MPLGQSLTRIASAVIPPTLVVPAALLLGVTVLYRFHRFWRWIRIGSLWSNPDNFLQLSAGAGLNLLVGDKTAVRVAALMVWIPSRIVDCIDEYNRLAKAFGRWVEAIRGDYPRRPRVRWAMIQKNSILSPSQEVFLKETLIILRMRIERIVVSTYQLIKRIWLLSMRCTDAYEALCMKQGTTERAIREIVLDGTNAISRIAEKKDMVQEKLESNAQLVNSFLRKIGSHMTVDNLVAVVSTAMDGVSALDQGVKKVTSFAGGMITDLGKHAIFGVFSLLGIPEKIPAKLMPGTPDGWEQKVFGRKLTESYVPTEDVTCPAFKRIALDAVEVVTIDRSAQRGRIAPFPCYTRGFKMVLTGAYRRC